MAKKQATRKPAARSSNSLPQSQDIPEGMRQMGGGYAPTWNPKKGEFIHGPATSEVKEVEMTIGRKKQTRRCVEITDQESGKRLTVWESAALVELFDSLSNMDVGTIVYLRFDGLGTAKKAGQNPPKLFTAAIAA